MLLGIDTGGTFTDFVLYKDNKIIIHKVLSTPSAPEKAIIQGITELGLLGSNKDEINNQKITIVHGSTVATNAVLLRKGVRTVYISNKGLADVLTIARQTRPFLYQLQTAALIAPVESELCLEVESRNDASGVSLTCLSDSDCQQLLEKVQQLKPTAIAINLLFSYLNPKDEKKLLRVLQDQYFVSVSSRILPEQKEYERGIATWLNSYVGPLVKGYIKRLKNQLPDFNISVMQSSGGTIAAEYAGDDAVRMLLSGPAGGMAGAKYMADLVSGSQILSFDMGGTSTDVAMIDKTIQLTTEGYIGPFPVAVSMVDMHTIGAGGGSIAFVDTGGLLRVGPQSAGADPGPACYGLKAVQATVTDANLVLGRLPAQHFLGGSMKLDRDAAYSVVQKIADLLNLDLYETALGIIQIANEHMTQALRVMSVQRGLDPRSMNLVSFGGAGGLHVCALADSLAIKTAIVPIHSGVLSAFGMLVAPKARYLAHGYLALVNKIVISDLNEKFLILINKGITALSKEAVATESIQIQRQVDLRYKGQSNYITVNVDSDELNSNVSIASLSSLSDIMDLSASVALFHTTHLKRYGHEIDLAVELVNIRVVLKSDSDIPNIETRFSSLKNSKVSNNVEGFSVYGIDKKINAYQRDELYLGQKLIGPALIIEQTSTTFLDNYWQAEVVAMGNLVLTRN